MACFGRFDDPRKLVNRPAGNAEFLCSVCSSIIVFALTRVCRRKQEASLSTLVAHVFSESGEINGGQRRNLCRGLRLKSYQSRFFGILNKTRNAVGFAVS